MQSPERTSIASWLRPRHARMAGILLMLAALVCGPATAMQPRQGSAPAAPLHAKGGALPAETLATLLPATVYFQGKTAPVQLRNAAAFQALSGEIAWVALVDSSGYASDVQEKYQFYLVTEAPLSFGDALLPAGAYGGGYVGNRFLIMDIGGHTVAQGALQTDADLRRPRPLQLTESNPGPGYRLYLGRHWVALRLVPDTHR